MGGGPGRRASGGGGQAAAAGSGGEQQRGSGRPRSLSLRTCIAAVAHAPVLLACKPHSGEGRVGAAAGRGVQERGLADCHPIDS